LDATTVGQAVVRKIVQGTNVTLSSTGADSGTGDVTVSVMGAVVNGFISKTSAYTLTSADNGKYVICSGGSWTLTLPAPALGLSFLVRNDMGITGTTGTITIATNGGTIDNVASIPLLPQQEATIITDSTNWRSFGRQREVVLGTRDISISTASDTILLPVGYRVFEILFNYLTGSIADQNLMFQLSFDGGNTWQTTGYYFMTKYTSSATAVSAANQNNVAQATLGGMGTGGTGQQAKLVLYPGLNGPSPSWLGETGYYYATGSYGLHYTQWGCLSIAGTANAFKYYQNTGNLTHAFLTVKGVV
jgi:hypothetical protein